MLDKKHDGFFDEDSAEKREEGELLKIIESGAYDKEIKSRIKEDGAADAPTGGIAALRDALNARMPLQGKVTGVAKAGLTVKILGHRAFCPISQIDVKYTSDVNEYLGKTLEFVVTRVKENGKNIVVSRVPLFEAGLEEHFKKLTDVAGTGKTFSGKISKIVEFGLFVDVGGLEGLVHISEVSWERAQNLNDSFTVGQEVEFVVLKTERKDSLRNSKISLSIKQAHEDPWKKAPDQLTVGEAVSGKVTRLADFGAFVEVLPGVEGLVHVSEMAWGRRVHHPSEIVKRGQTVKVTVLGIDTIKRSVALSLKDLADDPWHGIEGKLAVGADIAGTVARKAKFGYFIDLFEGVTGLLVPSRIAADKRDSLKIGDAVTVQVESIDIDSRRVSLSLGMDRQAGKERVSDDAKEYMKKQNAKQEKKDDGSQGTEFGAALLKALGNNAPQKNISTEKTPVKEISVKTEAAAEVAVVDDGDDKSSKVVVKDDKSSKKEDVKVADDDKSSKSVADDKSSKKDDVKVADDDKSSKVVKDDDVKVVADDKSSKIVADDKSSKIAADDKSSKTVADDKPSKTVANKKPSKKSTATTTSTTTAAE